MSFAPVEQAMDAAVTRGVFPGVVVLVNVAGVVSFGSAEALAEAEWDRVLGVNLKGSFLACQAVVAGMKRSPLWTCGSSVETISRPPPSSAGKSSSRLPLSSSRLRALLAAG